ncbi:RNA polymerase sigma-70 ECF-like protein [Candidatus Sulfopaludibacter sp. SbA6]|nr:RNA polymerase sigma-70 ECF-like protein [Candidatus Sulfopaludibacter sp. SbA6]
MPASTASTGEVTGLLAELRLGNKNALGRLMPLIYEELRRLAGHYLQAERIGHTLQPTALVHEAYLRLAGEDRAEWQNRAQFMAVAARLMRRILVDYARGRATDKRGGGAVHMDVSGLDPSTGGPQVEEILAVDEVLRQLSELDPQQGRVVELRYFAGLTVEETAEALGISPRTVKRDWAMASAWLRRELSPKALG